MHAFRFTPTVAAVAMATAGVAQAAPVYSTDRNAFVAANPHLAVEGFEVANIASGQDAVFAGPLSSNTNNSYFGFGIGNVASGFAVEAIGSGEIYLSRDVGGNSGANVSSNRFAENMNVWFTFGITAIGIDLMPWQGNDGGWGIELYDRADNLIGSFSTAAGSFFGVVSDTAVARMFLDKPDSGAVIDNLRFGVATHTVPEPSSLLLAGAAALAMRCGALRRRRTPAAPR